MYRIGQKEIDAVARLIESRQMFRYREGGLCERFERRYSKYLGIDDCIMCSSGTTALTAALVGAGVGPGDEVLVPACTYIATAIAVVAAGAIPVIVDIDESILISPEAIDEMAGPKTKAVMPVHMWGMCCDMDAIMAVAEKHGLVVVEDACQAVGGGYKGRKLGTFGKTGGFSFNYFKNMSCGEGGAAVARDPDDFLRVRCMIDCCRFYWTGREDAPSLFTSNGARASELEGAVMNVQLDRLEPTMRSLRKKKQRVLRETVDSGLTPVTAHSLDYECGSHVMYVLPSEEQAVKFSGLAGTGIAGRTGRHVYTEWDPIFEHAGGPSDRMNAFKFEENQDCRMDYRKDMCAKSLDILNRTVMIGLNPDLKRPDVSKLIRRLNRAAKAVL
ncbi:MAG: aminotransferase class V-fold PLP-dependent enzyme [Lentisphaerae bacterium]|jgi:dTDP-4-amino-4,6-dideoxygalactose transaminase|nr:aminotransferase class V-fold PLP-dependent enzyme [Lentisphaerota bacterium]MBT4822027.1 aminotransferase class V-fold PLP-dependent enzyme [Lentisphaerota bacterium]MBT5610031.1 aminotransferase class V-fold PLP-dependent enzyme [Lentisphaerota bacterium]MBT7055569.1 aminotransferase class V-fold PLP-dependent enzyme [Lentisphaerota bacterium]MBT7841476.1 aminotransferase class V-fold PLP-dependent enzyme [Lentisphaerota bacterium]